MLGTAGSFKTDKFEKWGDTSGKGRYLLKRFIYIVFVFFIISILMFFIYKLMPGDPVTMMLGEARNNMQPDAYQELYERTKESLA